MNICIDYIKNILNNVKFTKRKILPSCRPRGILHQLYNFAKFLLIVRPSVLFFKMLNSYGHDFIQFSNWC